MSRPVSLRFVEILNEVVKQAMLHRLVGVCTLFSGLLLASASGPGPGLAGAPGEGDCTSCHGAIGTAGKVTITAGASATTYTPGQTIRMRVTLEDPSAARWGFSLTARKTSDTSAGVGTLTPAGSQTLVESAGGAEFISHSATGTFAGTRNSVSWEFDWRAPAAGTGGVTFFVAGNAANRNNSADGGDRIYRGSLALTEAAGSGGGGATPTANTHSAPGLIYGGGWSSTLYFVNGSDSEVSFDVNLRKNDGTALDLNGAGATQKVTIAARGLGVISAGADGALAQGSASFDLPDTVTGQVLVKLATQNQPDQEVVLPVSRTADQRTAVQVFDDTVINSLVSVLNPSGSEANITMTVRDDKGATVGTSELKLAAGARVVFPLKDRVADAGGKRGTLSFSASTGAVSAAVIRFGGASLVASEALASESGPEQQ